jgi:hypothetical protein
MAATTFDSLGYFEKLKAAGVPEQQAKAHTDAMREIIEDKLATKQDLRGLEIRLELKLAELRADIIKWVAGMLIAQAAVIAALVKLL